MREQNRLKALYYHNSSTALLAIIMLGIWTTTSQAEISRSPYLSFINDPENSMVIGWGTDSYTVGMVQYAIDTLYQFQAATADSDTIHHVELTGLIGNTQYFYRLISDGDTVAGDFWTEPSIGDTFEIIAYGDSRSRPWVHGRVVELYMNYSPRLILNSGDIALNGEIWEFDAYLFQPAAEALCRTQFISCVGGHDADSGSFVPNLTFNNYRTLMEYPGNELFFSFDYGPIHFVVLNTEVANQFGPETEQTQWLEADLAATVQAYRIVLFHMPPYTSGHHLSNMHIREHWCPIFRDNHVQMVINGHNHYYQRSEPGDGIVYVVTGGGGAGLYPPTYDSNYVVSAYQAHHFVELQVSPDSIEITAIDTSETEIDQFSIFPWIPTVPETLENITIKQDSTGLQLQWEAVRLDTSGTPMVVDEYRIYRNLITPYFLPDSGCFLTATPDTVWMDTVGTLGMDQVFYRVTAVVFDD